MHKFLAHDYRFFLTDCVQATKGRNLSMLMATIFNCLIVPLFTIL